MNTKFLSRPKMKLKNKFILLFVFSIVFLFGIFTTPEKIFAWTSVGVYDNNSGTNWQTSIEYRAHWNGSSTADVWGPVNVWSDAGGYAFNNPFYNVDPIRDNLKWLTACVDPEIPIDADSDTIYGIEFDDVEVDVTCKTGINNKIYGACDSPNNKGDVNLEDLCPASNTICVVGGHTNYPAQCVNSCGGTNNCTLYKRECYKQGPQNPGCRIYDTIENASACDGGTDGRCAPPPPGNRTDSSDCQGPAHTDRAAVIHMNWNAIDFPAANNPYDIQLEQTDGSDPHNINGIENTIYDVPGSGCTTGPGGCNGNGLPWDVLYHWRVRGHTSSGHSGPTDWSGWNNITTANCNGDPDLDIAEFTFQGGNVADTTTPHIVIRNRQNTGYSAATNDFDVKVCNGPNLTGDCRTHRVSQTVSEGETIDLSDASEFQDMPRPDAAPTGNPHTASAKVDVVGEVVEYDNTNNTASDDYVTTATIKGHVYQDNKDGSQTLYDQDLIDPLLYHRYLQTQVTDIEADHIWGNFLGDDGIYDYETEFRGDTFRFDMSEVPQYYNLVSKPANFTLNQNVTNKDFHIELKPASVKVHVYYDYNGNGAQDLPEDTNAPGINFTFGQEDDPTPTTYKTDSTTDATHTKGYKTIANLDPTNYTAEVTPPGDYGTTTLNPVTKRVLPPLNQTINFGIQPPPPECNGGLTSSRSSAHPGQTATLTCVNPTTSTGDTPNYSWSTDLGTIANVNNASTTWTAPSPYWNLDTFANPTVTICNPGTDDGDFKVLCQSYDVPIEIVPLLTISGKVFVDKNKDGYSTADSNYTGGITVKLFSGTVDSGTPLETISNSTGSFKFANGNLIAGEYTVVYDFSPIADEYILTYPVDSVPPQHTVTVGLGQCDSGDARTPAEADCDPVTGEITDSNFGISNSIPWIQTGGSDAWFDNGITNKIQTSATCNGNGTYMSININGTPGIIYSGVGSTNFGSGSSSINKWIVGGLTYPEPYGPTASENIRTSFNNIMDLTIKNGIDPTPLTSLAGCNDLSNCNLPASFPGGVYLANGDLNLKNSNYTFSSNSTSKNYVILVKGDLYLEGEIHVPKGYTALFTVGNNDDGTGGNIHVASSVGTSTITDYASSQIEGWYSADASFIIDGLSGEPGKNTCPVADKRLNVAGAIVVNAALGGGEFENTQRDLCEGDLICPVFYIQERPDFTLNAPAFLQTAPRIWQEVAP